MMRMQLLLVSVGFIASCAAEPVHRMDTRTLLTRSDTLMGTNIELILIADPGRRAEAALDRALAELARVEDQFTTWRDSPLTRVNAGAGDAVSADDEVLRLIERAVAICKTTAKAFDPTYGGAPIDCGRVEIDRLKGTVTMPNGMSLGLGGIAKGYAVDRAADTLRLMGYQDFVVNAGGDLLASGRYKDNLWQVGIKHPRLAGKELAVLPMSGYALATSGDYERPGHILDPRSGLTARRCQSVTILARTAAVADALATGVFVLGPAEGLLLVESMSGVEALIVGEDGSIHVSRGLTNQPG